MPKRPFIRKQKRKRHGVAFWDSEYASGGEHLALSSDESEDLAKFVRWQARQKNEFPFNDKTDVLDLGTGNGRNLIFLAREQGVRGTGFDISTAAIAEAKRAAAGLPLSFEARGIAGDLPVEDSSQDLVLDMMTSHFLKGEERKHLLNEIHRVLNPGGWLFMKTFLRDDDLHTERLIKDYPADEPGSYIHPVIGVYEHAYGEDELLDFLSEKLIIHKIYRSHKHRSHGKARKRRTISVYAQKDPYK
jgi:SAM-dependent methyltransferase